MVRPAILLFVLTSAAHAQRVVTSLDLGGSHVRYGDSVAASAATLSPAARVEWDHATLGADGSLSQFSGGWSTQGFLSASLYTPTLGAFLGELSGTTGGSAHNDGARTGQSLGVGRLHFMRGRWGVWGGAGVGTTWDGGHWSRIETTEAAVWSYVGAATALASVTPTRVADSIRYADAELALRFELPAADLGVSGGLRSGDRLPALDGNAKSWGSLTLTAWVAPRLALLASAGSYPVDYTQGFPGGRFFSVGVRLGTRPARHGQGGWSLSEDARRSTAARASRGGVIEFRLTTATDGRRLFRVDAPRAHSVEISGDFTDWQPIAMTKGSDGWWSVALPVRRGTYEVNLRIDGARWVVPPGLTEVRDEFGGTVGVLSVP
jgi:hypothetical protein